MSLSVNNSNKVTLLPFGIKQQNQRKCQRREFRLYVAASDRDPELLDCENISAGQEELDQYLKGGH